jgi:phosphocarrier protein HPr
VAAKASADVTIVNEQGLHARPSSLIVKTAAAYRSELTLRVEDRSANGKSIIEVMMLASPKGTQVRLEASGEDAEALVAAVARLFASGFQES